MTTTTLQEKTARASSDYKDALAALDVARQTFMKGSGNSYARALERQQTIQSKLAGVAEDIRLAHQLFKTTLEKSNFVTTDAVKSALLEKSDAQAIEAELKIALEDTELAMLEHMIPAARDAERYREAYSMAHNAYARLQAYEALQQCSETLGRALALLKHVPSDPAWERLINDETELRERRIGFVWKALKEMAAQRPEAERRPHIPKIGMLELGQFAGLESISPAAALKRRRELAEQVANRAPQVSG